MKRSLKFTLLSACVVAVAYLGTAENKEVQDLAFNNIEALANTESGNGSCFGSGSVDCNGYKVSWKVTGYSLDDFE